MLVSNKKYDQGDVISFRLVTGDEIIARVSEETDSDYVLDKPCTVLPSERGMGLIQTVMTADQERKFTLSKNHVIMSGPSIDAMQKHYLKTTTGIEPITRGSIIT
jgi:hypothetical protein